MSEERYATDEEVKEYFDSIIDDIVDKEIDRIERELEEGNIPPMCLELEAAETMEERVKILEKHGMLYME